MCTQSTTSETARAPLSPSAGIHPTESFTCQPSGVEFPSFDVGEVVATIEVRRPMIVSEGHVSPARVERESAIPMAFKVSTTSTERAGA